ncbi:MAG: ERCC4 domain-containing protein [Thermofilum sp.]
MQLILYSPFEPDEIKNLLAGRGIPHRLTEQFGADFLIPRRGFKVAVQRKTGSDLLASLEDGRLAREVALLKTAEVAVLVVEDVVPPPGSRYSKEQVRNLLRSVYHRGVRVEYTSSPADTVEALLEMERYYSKDDHLSLLTRPKTAAGNDWYIRTNREWAVFLLQGFPGIGPVLAGEIFDHFGRIPLAWDCTREELARVPGLGRRRTEKLWDALNGR